TERFEARCKSKLMTSIVEYASNEHGRIREWRRDGMLDIAATSLELLDLNSVEDFNSQIDKTLIPEFCDAVRTADGQLKPHIVAYIQQSLDRLADLQKIEAGHGG
ncbi:MAG: hypothetical protein AAGA30_20580, partial [Planctomycetota bacterium]